MERENKNKKKQQWVKETTKKNNIKIEFSQFEV